MYPQVTKIWGPTATAAARGPGGPHRHAGETDQLHGQRERLWLRAGDAAGFACRGSPGKPGSSRSRGLRGQKDKTALQWGDKRNLHRGEGKERGWGGRIKCQCIDWALSYFENRKSQESRLIPRYGCTIMDCWTNQIFRAQFIKWRSSSTFWMSCTRSKSTF